MLGKLVLFWDIISHIWAEKIGTLLKSYLFRRYYMGKKLFLGKTEVTGDGEILFFGNVLVRKFD